MAPQSRKAYCLVVDVGRSMSGEMDGDVSKMETVKEAIRSLILQKMIEGATDFAVVLVGSDKSVNNMYHKQPTQYAHIEVLQEMIQASTDLTKKVKTISSTSRQSDLVAGILIGMDVLHYSTENKKYEKKLIVFTDAETKLNGESDLRASVPQIEAIGADLTVIVFGSRPLPETADSLEQFCTDCGERGQYLGAESVLDALSNFTCRQVKQISKCRTELEITSTMKIPVWCYIKTKVATLPTLKKEDARAAHGGSVKLERSYLRADNPEGEEVTTDNRTMAMRYGSEFVPVADYDKEAMKLETEKCLRIVGFFAKDQVPIYRCMSNAEAVAAEPGNETSSMALSSLIHAMNETGKVALARYSFRKNAEPRLVCLSPHVSAHGTYECLYLVQVPYSEDARDNSLIFPALPAASEKQLDAIDEVIDNLELVSEESGELLKAKLTLNPTMQRFWQTVVARAEDPSFVGVAPVEGQLDTYLHPEKSIWPKASHSFKKAETLFPLEVSQTESSVDIKKRMWRQVMKENLLAPKAGEIDTKKIRVADVKGGGGGIKSQPVSPKKPAPYKG